jgi:hypothetical protein
MSAPNLDPKLPLPKLRRHVRHTLQKLRIHTWGKTLGTQLENLGKELDTALANEAKFVDAIENAETVVDIGDLDLNECARQADINVKGYYTGQNLKEIRETLFGPGSLSEFVRPLMGQQLRGMRSWPKYLATLRPVEYAPLIAKIETALKNADAAISALTQAEVDLENFRTGTHYPLVKKVSLLFHDIWAAGTKQAKDTGMPGEALGLFLPTRKHRPPLTIARARAEVTAREGDLTDAKAALAGLLADAEAEDKAEKEREALAERIAVLKKEQAETQARIDALQDELDRQQ